MGSFLYLYARRIQSISEAEAWQKQASSSLEDRRLVSYTRYSITRADLWNQLHPTGHNSTVGSLVLVYPEPPTATIPFRSLRQLADHVAERLWLFLSEVRKLRL